MPHKTQASNRKSSTKATDAIHILTADHQKVDKMFAEFEKNKDKMDDEEKQLLVQHACVELIVHAQLEEEIFYPALREVLDDTDLIDEADVEHASIKQLILEIQAMQPDDDLYDAKFTVIGEYVKHHVKEEQGEMFPKAKKSKLDLEQLGKEITQRKNQLMVKHGMEMEEKEGVR